ncbi:MAG TPA: hypothetical protein VGD78_12985 [Chthoniobacterales bacterium]
MPHHLHHRPGTAGSALIYVVAAVGLASMAAVGYLSFTNYHRERAARELSGVGHAIDLETRVLRVKAAVQAEAVAEAKVDLAMALQAGKSSSATPTHLDLQRGDGEGNLVTLDRFADPTGVLEPLSLPGDPFTGAQARVTPLNLDAWMDAEVAGNSRNIDERLVEKPEIDVRQIPLSEFTVFAAAGANRLNAQNFNGDIGRVFLRGDLVVAGRLQTHYPLVATGDVRVAPEGALTLQGSEVEPVTVPGGFDSSTADFFGDAHSRFASELVTPQSLPVEANLASSVYGGTSQGEGSGEAFNVEAFRQNCTVHVTVRRPLVAKPRSPQAPYELEVTGLQNGVGTPFRVADHNGVAVVAVNYPAFRSVAGPLAVSIEVYGSNGLERAAEVLVRGGESLSGDFSLVTPHPIVISGNFNTHPVNGIIPAASLITGQEVRVENPTDAMWAHSVFGDAT